MGLIILHTHFANTSSFNYVNVGNYFQQPEWQYAQPLRSVFVVRVRRCDSMSYANTAATQ
jgi:hypothetical protein